MLGYVIFGEGPFGGPLPPWRRIVEAGAAVRAESFGAGVGGATALGGSVLTGTTSSVSRGLAVALTAPDITADADTHPPAAASEAPKLLVAKQPDLLPLRESHEADVLESELKALFIDLFNTYIRPDERYVNVLGMPQHGPRALVETSLANDGLAIYRGADAASGAGAYLLRAWRAMNPKRGRHLLETYLQLLWPNVWTVNQMWQDVDADYPEALAAEEDDDRFLTSRVEVTLPARATTGGDANAIASGLRASLPARMVMKMSIVDEATFDAGLVMRYYAGATIASFEGSFA